MYKSIKSHVISSLPSEQKLKRILEGITRDGGVAEGEGGGAKDGSVPLEGLEGSLDDIISLCHRNSQNLNQQQREVRGQGSAQGPHTWCL